MADRLSLSPPFPFQQVRTQDEKMLFSSSNRLTHVTHPRRQVVEGDENCLLSSISTKADFHSFSSLCNDARSIDEMIDGVLPLTFLLPPSGSDSRIRVERPPPPPFLSKRRVGGNLFSFFFGAAERGGRRGY